MKQWLTYLMCVGPPSLDELADQVNELINDEEEASKGLLSMDNVGHHLWDYCLQMQIMKNDLL
jgi:hypothetical protein